MGCAKVTAWCWHPITIQKMLSRISWKIPLVEGHQMSRVPLPNVATFIISSFSVFLKLFYLKTLLAILFLRDKNLEKTIPVGVRNAEPTLRSSGSVKSRAYFLGWCHCSSAKERGASLTGLEMKETKNIHPSYVWETMPALNNLKCRLRAEGHLSTVRTSDRQDLATSLTSVLSFSCSYFSSL